MKNLRGQVVNWLMRLETLFNTLNFENQEIQCKKLLIKNHCVNKNHLTHNANVSQIPDQT